MDCKRKVTINEIKKCAIELVEISVKVKSKVNTSEYKEKRDKILHLIDSGMENEAFTIAEQIEAISIKSFFEYSSDSFLDSELKKHHEDGESETPKALKEYITKKGQLFKMDGSDVVFRLERGRRIDGFFAATIDQSSFDVSHAVGSFRWFHEDTIVVRVKPN
ncbi:hypothetical protein SAMN05421743_101231 [Thalassobacillus cyri]|uniref:Uncharacterized protein n=1 Tax=Thalassobacillus cyri TaxID=571932 RepID=A0A1H3VXZ7_9BACI|nr:hypothetical protein [Thalassobacillus cyri]SDZ79561.1 hypothetical protein SAMN05421743_101231 [Thalassobacillus cyri]